MAGLEQEGTFYWRTPFLEVYAVLQATRPDGPRAVDMARFQLVVDKMDLDRAEVLAEELVIVNIQRST